MNLPQNFDFTQSKLQDYVDCPYRFFMRYIRQIKYPALIVDDALEFEQRGQTGARFHRLVQQYLLGMPESRLSEIAAADPSQNMRRWWDDFFAFIPPLLQGERWVEIILSTNLLRQRLLAKYDLILAQEDGPCIIFDWKTSQRKPRKEWLLERVQTRIYRFILSQSESTFGNKQNIDPELITMAYWFTAAPEVPVTLPYNQAMVESDKGYLSRLISEILERDENGFYRTDDLKKCHYCVYRSHCDRGVKAGSLESFEDFDVNPESPDFDFDFESITEIEF